MVDRENGGLPGRAATSAKEPSEPKCAAEAATKLTVICVVKVVHVQLKVHHVGLLEMHSVPGGEAAAHCKITLDHPWHPGRGNPGRERGRRVEKRSGKEKTEEKSKEGERRGTGGGRGKGEGGYAGVS